MYFNDEKSNTNIDRELNEKTIRNSLKINLKKIIIIAIILLLLIIILIALSRINSVSLKLKGENYIKMVEGSEYIEPGYIATDKKGNDLSEDVIISGKLDTTKTGIYNIVYKLKNKKLTRTIEVIEKGTGETLINLKGEEIIYINIGEEYTEPGYTCIDTVDGDITDKVQVINKVDNTKLGAYRVIYEVTNSTDITTMVSRIIVVE